ncbi:MAG: cbb3-type cytochrome c oxidase subunit I [Deltaproteobacteria bacterium]|nr:cbb3-type cytochrome c oxidase subunit I [Deltaproteobacteria bacterium]
MRIAGLLEGSEASTARLVFGWLLLAVSSLMFAGMFAVLVVLARTPFIENMLPMGRDYIYVALVGHVDLAVVIWFLAFQGALVYTITGMAGSGKGVWSAGLGWASLALSCAGMLMVVIAAAFGLGRAELANYVPVLHTPVFYAGLLAFAAGVLLALVNAGIGLIVAAINGERFVALTVGMAICGLGVFIAFLCFGLSAYFQLVGATFEFERLFWGGGHILQTVNAASMAVAWALLARFVFNVDPAGERASKALFVVYLAFMLPGPFLYFVYDVSSWELTNGFTFLMRWGPGPSTVVFAIAAIWLVAARRDRNWSDPGLACLALSILLFVIGGVIGISISGINTKIPAHYHSNIGAVTVAFMGLFYKLLPSLGREVYFKRLSVVQPYLYAVGILLFVAGLYLAGAHGAARKTYAGSQGLDGNTWKMIGMVVMGLGGAVSIAGGIAFVVNALASLVRRKTLKQDYSDENSP